MSNLLTNLANTNNVELCIDEKCLTTLPITSNNSSLSYKIEYPKDYQILPLAGGAVVSIDISGLKLESDKSKEDALENNLSRIKNLTLSKTLNDLLQLHVEVNDRLFDIAAKDYRYFTKGDKSPTIYISKYGGTDSTSITATGVCPDLYRISEFKYVPFEVFKKVFNNLFSSNRNQDFLSMVGVSGRSFSYLKQKIESTTLSDADIIDFVLEFFPIASLSGDEILSVDNKPKDSGYYTIKNDKVWIKIPDLSGQNSAGLSDIRLIDSEHVLFFEFYYNSTPTRLKIQKFKAPIQAFLNSSDGGFLDFPTPGTVTSSEVEVKISTDSSENFTAYLSPILDSSDIPDALVNKYKGLENYNDFIEVYSHPDYGRSIEPGREPVISDLPLKIKINEGALRYVPLLNRAEASTLVPFVKYNSIETIFQSLNRYTFFGFKNRPDILLSNFGISKDKNDVRYHKLSNAGKVPLLSANMPKISLGENSAWIKEVSSSQGANNVYSKKYNSLSFLGISPDSFSGGFLKYSVYVKDDIGQVTKVNGGPIFLSKPLPILEFISPSGFDGDTAVVYGTDTTLTFYGPNISCVQWVNISNAQGVDVSFSRDTRPDLITETSSDSVSLNLIQADFFNFLPNVSGTYEVKLYCSPTVFTNPVKIYIVLSELEPRPGKPKDPVKFDVDDFTSSEFGSKPIVGVPVFKDETNAKISLKTRKKILKSDDNIYAYIGLPFGDKSRSIIQHFSSSNKIFNIIGNGKDLLCPVEVSYLLSASPEEDFYKSPFSKKEVVLNFPGKKYSKYNFSVLQDLPKAFIIITNKSLVDLGSGNSFNLDSVKANSQGNFSYALVEMGNLSNDSSAIGPAFIEAAGIAGIMARGKDSSSFKSTFPVSIFSQDSLNEAIGEAVQISPGEISISKKIKELALIVSGVPESRTLKKYKFFLEDQDITNKITRQPKVISPSKLLFYFKNLVPEKDGILTFSVKKNYELFGVSEYENNKYIAKGTGIIKSSGYELSRDTNKLVLINEIVSLDNKPVSDASAFLAGDAITGFVGFENDRIIETIYPGNKINGLIFNLSNKDQNTYKTFIPIDIAVDKNIKLKVAKDGGDLLEEVIYPDLIAESVTTIGKDTLVIPSVTTFEAGEYIESDDKKSALVFFGAKNFKHPSIKFNVPEVKTVNGIPVGEAIDLKAGDTVRVFIDNISKYFDILLGGQRIDLTGKPEPFANGYVVSFKIPEGFQNLVFDDCLKICPSTDNPDRSRLNSTFGPPPYAPGDLDKYSEGQDKVPTDDTPDDADESAPCIPGKICLTDPPVKLKLIRSFCDLSIAMVGELRFFLNGFKTLMIPVKIIFAIIDVLCSLINPVKIGKALLRLLESLYELILLLPFMSVPFMFLKLLLHILKAFECLFEKIVSLSESILQIWKDINNIIQNFNTGPLTGLKTLQDTLETYLNEFDLELKFLDPVISILAIFIELLQINFKFPCTVVNEDTPEECSIDGSILAGIVSGILAPDLEILTQYTLPVCQPYSISEDGSTTSLSQPANEDVIALREEGTTWLESMNISPDSLRSESALGFNATMAPTYTKNKKKYGAKSTATFYFNSRAESTTLSSKNIDPNQTLDAPLKLVSLDGNSIKVSSFGNLISPIDGAEFLNVNLETLTASVKPLIISYEIPQYDVNPTTGIQEQVGVTTATRTLNDIPMVALIDDELNMYFIEADGIKYNADGEVYEIVATIQNLEAARKNRFLKEEVELEDGSQINLYDFPQLYFFDMRQAGPQIDQFLQTCALNSYPYNANNADDIIDIVQEQKLCIENWFQRNKEFSSSIRSQLQNGVITNPNITNASISLNNKDLELCTLKKFDDICKFVVSSLNTSFKILEDIDETPNPEYISEVVDEASLGGIVPNPPPLTGAREYAAGIGDSASIQKGGIATIEIIPRDYYDNIIVAPFADKVSLEIIQDSTGSAVFVKNSDGSIISKSGNSYIAKLTSLGVGEVKVKAAICDQTIQALTYRFDEAIVDPGQSGDCVPNIPTPIAGGGIGGLLRVDRVLSIFFVESGEQTIPINRYGGDVIITNPQEFGTRLEN